MADYKSMYYHLAGRTATAVDVLDATIGIMEANAKALMATLASVEVLAELKEKLKLAQQITEEMFIDSDNEDDCEKTE